MSILNIWVDIICEHTIQPRRKSKSRTSEIGTLEIKREKSAKKWEKVGERNMREGEGKKIEGL